MGSGSGAQIDHEAQACPLARRAEVARKVDRQSAKIGRLIRSLRAARLDAGEVEQRVHESQQPHAVALRDCEQRAIVLRQAVRLRQQVVERPEHQRQRRAELVADVAEERGLGAIQLGELLGASALVLERALSRERTGNIGADQSHEIAIVVVELAPRAQPANEIAVRFVGARGELEDRRLFHRFRPRPAGKLDVRRRLGEHNFRFAPERPGVETVGRIDLQRGAVVSGGDACDGFESADACGCIPAIESRERHILAVALQNRGGIAEDIAR
jgi:hypothetical protein